MEKKQTAVEWLYERLERMIPKTALYDIDKKQYYEQAKEMEKEQIIDAFKRGTINEMNGIEELNSEQYYNETFKQD
jgi:hypothetical protein